jgi:predicted nucleic acid-binding protein
MMFLPDTNACITLLRHRNIPLIARWQSTKATDVVLCSVVVYEMRHGAAPIRTRRANMPSWTCFSVLSLHCLSTIKARAFALRYSANSSEPGW